jgi:hypothetical protein
VINEVQVAGSAGASDEFVEILNPCTTEAALDGVKLVYRAAAGVTDVLLSDLTSFGKLAPGARLLLAGATFSVTTLVPDGKFTSGLAAAGGGLGLRSATGLIDGIGYGTATNEFVEGTVVAAPAALTSLSRSPDGTDTNSNVADFKAVTPTPGAANL